MLADGSSINNISLPIISHRPDRLLISPANLATLLVRRLSLVVQIKFTFFNQQQQPADIATNTNTAAMHFVGSKHMTNIDKKEIAISAIKSIFSNIPIAGQAITEIAFEYRGRLKQNRLNYFIELLSDYFSKSSDINLDNIKTEDFSDLFEAVILRVVQTKSQEKHKRFRDILINQLTNPNNLDNSDTYLDLVSSLSEMEIEVLKQHQAFDEAYNSFKEKHKVLQHEIGLKETGRRDATNRNDNQNYEELNNQIHFLENERQNLKKEIDSRDRFRNHNFYNISASDFLYCKQSLYSKGLLIDKGVGAIGTEPFQLMAITEFGREFIHFILKN